MTQTLETLSRRTKSMKGIRSVVHTMKTLSVINSAPYDHAAKSIGVYHDTVLDGLHAFVTHYGPVETSTPDIGQQVLIVFGSDHGLCGNYNEALASHVAAHIDVNPVAPLTVLCVGAQMADALSDQGIPVGDTLFPAASVDGIGRLANTLAQRLETIRHDAHPRDMAVSLAYVARDDAHGQQPVIGALLPLDAGLMAELHSKPWVSRSLPTFTMPPDDLFTALVRSHLFASLFRAIAEALMTENAARLALMQQAEQSVDDKLEELMSETRGMRQNEITTELLDVIIGFEALRKSKRSKHSLHHNGPDDDVTTSRSERGKR
jgi:F-type H+-transporting ATPase subunit gamma